MNIKDYEGVFKFKLIMPSLIILSWICMILGPFYFQETYQKICYGIIFAFCLRLIMQSLGSIVMFYKFWTILNRIETQSHKKSDIIANQASQNIIHAFIIPNYKEDIDLLTETLKKIALHPLARTSYMIFLAMEDHELNSDQKAIDLIHQFQDRFMYMNFTVHKIQKYEQQGKASNVSWCAERLGPIFQNEKIDEDLVFVTIIDADSWVPSCYIDEINGHMSKNFQKRHRFLYVPAQIYTRNNLEVPFLSRVCDLLNGFMHYNVLPSLFNISVPFSNYSLSFHTLKRIGFWDTCSDAIGEDMHMVSKSFWKTQGNMDCIPIYTMFNMINIETGKGYLQDIIARFWQAERHARGISDVAYNLNMYFRNPFNFKCFGILCTVFESFGLMTVLPWAFISMSTTVKLLEDYSLIVRSEHLLDEKYFTYMTLAIFFSCNISYILYEILKRRSTTLLYKLENESLLRIIQYFVFVTSCITLIALPAFIYACFGNLKSEREYILAEKHQKKGNKSIETTDEELKERLQINEKPNE